MGDLNLFLNTEPRASKTCNKCGYDKHVSAFEAMNDNGYMRPTCKDCYNKKRRDQHGGANREKEKRNELFNSVLKKIPECQLIDRYKKDGDTHYTVKLKYKGYVWETRQTSFVKGIMPWRNYKQNHLKGKNCVYKFLDKFGQVLYVGKSTKLPSRLSQHFCVTEIEKYKSFWKEDVVEVLYIELPTRTDMHIAEIYLIDRLKPLHNKSCAECDGTSFKLDIPKFKKIWVGAVNDKVN